MNYRILKVFKGSAAIALLLNLHQGYTAEGTVQELRESYSQGDNASLVELALYYAQGESELGNSDTAMDVSFNLLSIAANRHNNPVAQVNLGVFYQFGLSIDVNHARAAYWYDKAATNGNQSAVVKLADLYSRGVGTDVNASQAAELYTEAAEAGSPDAQVELGYMYEVGDIGEVNFEEARKWYEQAAQGGSEIGQYNLAEMYELGKGGPVDLDKAKEFYGLAAQQGLQEATEALARIK